MIRLALLALALAVSLAVFAPFAGADDSVPSVWLSARVKVAGGRVSLLGSLRRGEAAKVHALAPDSKADLTALLAESANRDVKVHVVPCATGLRVIGVEGRAGPNGAEVEDATYCWIIEVLARIPANGTFEIRGTHQGTYGRFFEVHVPEGGMEGGPNVGYVDVATAKVASAAPVSRGIVSGLRAP